MCISTTSLLSTLRLCRSSIPALEVAVYKILLPPYINLHSEPFLPFLQKGKPLLRRVHAEGFVVAGKRDVIGQVVGGNIHHKGVVVFVGWQFFRDIGGRQADT